MDNVNKIALIPSYEPDSGLINIVNELKSRNYTVVIVNDGSAEMYSEVFHGCEDSAHIISHNVNRGKGAAIKTGIEYIIEHFKSPYSVVTVDSDGQHRISDADNVSEYATYNRNTLVIGSRCFKGKIPLRSLLGNTITRLVFSLSTGNKINDTQTGLRAFSDELAEEVLNVEGERYEFEMNMLLNFSRRGIPIKEIPIETVYYDGNSGSHFNTVKDSYRIYKEILKFSAASFISFVIDYAIYCIIVSIGGTSYVTISNLIARLISGTVNYNLNKRVVFKDNEAESHPALRYILLATVIICGNTIVLNFLINTLAINKYPAKILTELLFFLISWLVQRTLIFRKKA